MSPRDHWTCKTVTLPPYLRGLFCGSIGQIVSWWRIPIGHQVLHQQMWVQNQQDCAMVQIIQVQHFPVFTFECLMSSLWWCKNKSWRCKVTSLMAQPVITFCGHIQLLWNSTSARWIEENPSFIPHLAWVTNTKQKENWTCSQEININTWSTTPPNTLMPFLITWSTQKQLLQNKIDPRNWQFHPHLNACIVWDWEHAWNSRINVCWGKE